VRTETLVFEMNNSIPSGMSSFGNKGGATAKPLLECKTVPRA